MCIQHLLISDTGSFTCAFLVQNDKSQKNVFLFPKDMLIVKIKKMTVIATNILACL